MTEKLFYEDSHRTEFTAKVISCEEAKDGYRVVLDQTVFFPEGGGQYADTGVLGTVNVTDVHEKDDVIYHYTTAPLEVGSIVTGKINWEERFEKMQQHTGEHIVSGIVHERFGYNNVGFHLGADYCTMDFDGTILNSAHRISEHTAQMLKRAEEAGVSLCVNTGRSFNDAMHLIQNCNCFDYIITSNGCDLRDLKKNVTIDCKTLSQETVEQVIALLKQYRVYFECFIQGQAVTEKNLIEILKADADVYADYLQGGGDCVQSVDNFKDYIPQETLAVSKLYVMAGSPQQAAEIRSALQSVQGLSCTSSGAQNIEVIPPFVDKADAVEEMARYVGISLSEVISIGDGENDMEMIRRCGCGIAMENGLQELQACADYICPSVSNEGAADAIEYFLGL